MEEQWKDVVGYENIYEVSNLGQVRNYHTGRILKQQLSWNGYLFVGLYKDKKLKSIKIHRLVANAFIPKEDSDAIQVDHKNKIRTDNRVENLRWVTNQQNQFNTTVKKSNTSGYKGIGWHKPSSKWRVQIKYNYKIIHGGLYEKLEDAIVRRDELEKEYFRL